MNQLELEAELVHLRQTVADLQQREAQQRLQADHLHAALEQLPVVSFTCRPEGDYGATYISESVREITGYRPEQFLADPAFWVDRVHPEDRQRILDSLPAAVARGRVENQYRWRVADGSYRWFESLLRTVHGSDGRIEYLAGAWRDITTRKVELLERERSGAETAAMLAGLPVVVYVCAVSDASETTYISPNVKEVLSYGPEEFIGDDRFWVERVHPEDRARIEALFAELLRQEAIEYEYRWRLADGTYVWILDLLRLVRTPEGEPQRILGAMHDITSRKRSEQELHAARAEARALSVRLLDEQERVERRLAERIHEDLSQNLAAMRLDLSWLKQRLQPGTAADQSRVERLIDLVERTLTGLQGVATDLRPTVLDDHGLVPAVASHVQDLARRSGLEIDLRVDPPGLSLDQERSTGVYRMLREALANVEQHARARHVQVELVLAHGELRAEVRDDGRGISAAEAGSPHSLGLAALRARAEALGGHAQVAGSASAGTRLTIHLPARAASAGPGQPPAARAPSGG